MWETVQPIFTDFVGTLLGGLLTVLAGFLIALAKKGFDWIGEKTKSIKNEDARKAVAEASYNLESIVEATVVSLQQSLGDEIKKSLEQDDGRYTREDLLALKDSAIAIVNHQITDSTRQVLDSAYSDLSSYISDLIEKSVRGLKS